MELSEQLDQNRKFDNHFIHPWEDFSTFGIKNRTIITSGKGIYVRDEEGNRLIDGPAGMWCVNIGYGRKEMAEAISEQALKLSYFAPWTQGSDVSSELTEKLCKLTPEGLNTVAYTTGGSAAVDSALRLVFFYNNVLGRPKKKLIISREDAYHGSTYLSAACSGKLLEKENMDMPIGLVHHVSNPNPSLRAGSVSIDEFCDEKVEEIEHKILELGPDNVAAFIAEPIMGSGGVIVPPPSYLSKVSQVCRKYDVLYISDEVVTAFGRLGHMFASRPVFDVTPDILITAKGITSGYVPMGAMFVSDAIIEAIKSADMDSKFFFNGYTYACHPVAAAAALKNLEVIESEKILDHVRNVAPYFRSRLNELLDYPVVTEVRGEGLMVGFECVVNPENPDDAQDELFAVRVDEICQQLGLLVRPIYNNCVMSPPLIINSSQIDDTVEILKKGIEVAMNEFGMS